MRQAFEHEKKVPVGTISSAIPKSEGDPWPLSPHLVKAVHLDILVAMQEKARVDDTGLVPSLFLRITEIG